jgi:hypothetical protein
MVYSRERLIVFDDVYRRLVALDAQTGAPQWIAGRQGEGPEEFAAGSAMVPAAEGGVLLFDPRLFRMSHVGADGRFRTVVPLASLGSQPNQGCAYGPGRFLVADVVRTDLMIVDSLGSVVEEIPLPWPDVAALPWALRQLMLRGAGESGRCLVALLTGRGFALLSPATGTVTAEYIERLELHGVGSRSEDKDLEYWAFIDGAFLSDTVVILPHGPDRSVRFGVLDYYSAATGAYLMSLRLPFRTNAIAFGEGLLFVFSTDGTRIIALRARQQ